MVIELYDGIRTKLGFGFRNFRFFESCFVLTMQKGNPVHA